MTRAVAIAVLATGCLSKPDPPTIDPRARLRTQSVVADVDIDGLDDLIVWGTADEADGPTAVVWISYGDANPEAPLSPPNTLLRPRFDDAKPWREVLDVELDDLTLEGLRDLTVAWAEDGAAPTGPIPSERTLLLGVFRQLPAMRTFADAILADPAAIAASPMASAGGHALFPTPIYVAPRDTMSGTPANQIVFGDQTSQLVYDLDDSWEATMPAPRTSGVRFAGVSAPIVDVVDTDRLGLGETDLVVVTSDAAYRTTDDPQNPWPTDPPVQLVGAHQIVRRVITPITDYILATTDASRVSILDARIGGNLLAWTLALPLPVLDVSLGFFGDALNGIDIVTLELDGTQPTLAIYLDVSLGLSPDANAFRRFASAPPELTEEYDFIAVGQLRGDPDPEIIALSSNPVLPPICYQFVAAPPQDLFVRCNH